MSELGPERCTRSNQAKREREKQVFQADRNVTETQFY